MNLKITWGRPITWVAPSYVSAKREAGLLTSAICIGSAGILPASLAQAACAPVAFPEQEYFTIPTSCVSKQNLPKISRGAKRYRCSRPEASGRMHTVGPGPSQRLAGKTFVPIESSEESIVLLSRYKSGVGFKSKLTNGKPMSHSDTHWRLRAILCG